MDTDQPFWKSKKFIAFLIAVSVAYAAAMTIPTPAVREQFLDVLRWAVTALLGGQSAVDVAKALVSRPSAPKAPTPPAAPAV